MVPPRVPQFNWIDLGLPSGTLWLDRLVGAPLPSDPGLYYQWGSVKGHNSSDVSNFNQTSYVEQRLNTITSDLSESQDAARAFYGPNAKMPSREQAQELIQYTSMVPLVNRRCKITSLINGHSITIYQGGIIQNNHFMNTGNVRVWLATYGGQYACYSMHGNGAEWSVHDNIARYDGLNIMAVHS